MFLPITNNVFARALWWRCLASPRPNIHRYLWEFVCTFDQIFTDICTFDHASPTAHTYMHQFLANRTQTDSKCGEGGWLFCTVISSAWHPIMTSSCMQKIGSVVMRYQLTCKYLHLLFKQTLAANKYYQKTYKYVHLCLCKIVGSCHRGDLLLYYEEANVGFLLDFWVFASKIVCFIVCCLCFLVYLFVYCFKMVWSWSRLKALHLI